MTRYTFKVNKKCITINKPIQKNSRKNSRKKNSRFSKPDKPVTYLEDTIRNWSMSDNLNYKQRISMRAFILQKKSGYSKRIACGKGRYKIVIQLPYLMMAYRELS